MFLERPKEIDNQLKKQKKNNIASSGEAVELNSRKSQKRV